MTDAYASQAPQIDKWKLWFFILVVGWALVSAVCIGFVIGVTFGKASIRIENYQGEDFMTGGVTQPPLSSPVTVPNVSVPKR